MQGVKTQMARYSLIMSDENYVKLVNMTTEQGITMGRLLNDIINEYLETIDPTSKTSCHYCEQDPVWYAFENGKKISICERCLALHKSELEGWRRIE